MPKPKESARFDFDVSQLSEALAKLFVPGEERDARRIRVRAVFRLGIKHNNGIPRPLKVVLGSAEEAKIIFQIAHSLKGEPVWLLRGLDLEERAKLKEG